MRVNGWVTVDEALEITGRGKTTVYKWVREGEVRTMRPKRALWLNLSDLRRAETKLPGRPRKKV